MTVTVTPASAHAGQASRGPRVTAVPLATSTSRSASVSKASPVGTVGLGPRSCLPCSAACALSPAVCGCSTTGTLPQGCDEAGHCLCRPEFDGPHCDRCRPGHHGYPDCRGEQRAGLGRSLEVGVGGPPPVPIACPCLLQPATATPRGPWISSAVWVGCVAAALATRAPPAGSAALGSTASPPVPVSVLAGGREGGASHRMPEPTPPSFPSLPLLCPRLPGRSL